jgi:hypothetical protein
VIEPGLTSPILSLTVRGTLRSGRVVGEPPEAAATRILNT